MSLTLPTFASGSRVRASALTQITAALNALTPIKVIKAADQAYAVSSIVLQNDTHLLVAGAANTIYEFELNMIYQESAGQGVDCKIAFTQPASCRLDAQVTGAHANWNGTPGTNLEAEWAAFQNETATTTSTRTFGTTTLPFGVKVSGTWQVGATAGNLRLQASQGTSSVNTLTIKAGSSLILRPMP
jgi:hypothetical protein